MWEAGALPAAVPWRVRLRPAGARRWALRAAVLVAGWVVGVVVLGAGFFLAASGGQQADHALNVELAARGVRAPGTVTGLSDHGGFGYEFTAADGTRRQGRGYAGEVPGGSVDGPLRGDGVPVVYDPRAPGRSCACDPAALLAQEHPVRDAVVPGMLLGVPGGLAVWLAVGRYRGWLMRQWPGLPVVASVQVLVKGPPPVTIYTIPQPEILKYAATMVVAPGRIGVHPHPAAAGAEEPPPAPEQLRPVVHTRRAVVLTGSGSLVLLGNPLYGRAGCLTVHLPDSWHLQDVEALLALAGFEAVHVTGARTDVPARVDDLPPAAARALQGSPDLWA